MHSEIKPALAIKWHPVDYAIWGALQQKVYHRRKFATLEQLKLTIIEVAKFVSAVYKQEH